MIQIQATVIRCCSCRRIQRSLTILLLCLLALTPSRSENPDTTSVLPHVDDCNHCLKCVVDTESTHWDSSFDHAGGPGLSAAEESKDEVANTEGRYDATANRKMLMSLEGSHEYKALNTSPAESSILQTTLSPKSPRSPKASRHLKSPNPFEDPKLPPWLRASAYRIGGIPGKFNLPNCTECRGCTTELSFMANTSTFFDRTYTNEKGATSGWIFSATTKKTPIGKAVVKVYCMPLPKRPGARVPTCSPETILKNIRLLLGLEKVAEECGFLDIIPRLWVEKISAIIPGIGFHVRWFGLWMEVAEGISLENFLHSGRPSRLPPTIILDLVQNKLNKTQVVRGAIFDLLTSQCDRHAQNIFVNEAGQIKLIDNEAALQNNWKNCGFDSILVPTTQKQEIVRLSNEFVNKLVTVHDARGKGKADPQLLLDYRCYLPEGSNRVMGTNYPPQIKQCLKDISELTSKQVQGRYGFVEESVANNLLLRARDMIQKGYEHAALFGTPQNAPGKRYRIQEPCCSIELSTQKHQFSFQCAAHEWEAKWELPVGDPTTGKDWRKAKPDTGTYVGGTYPDSKDLPFGVTPPL